MITASRFEARIGSQGIHLAAANQSGQTNSIDEEITADFGKRNPSQSSLKRGKKEGSKRKMQPMFV